MAQPSTAQHEKFQLVTELVDKLETDHQAAVARIKTKIDTMVNSFKNVAYLDMVQCAIESLEGDIKPNLKRGHSCLGGICEELQDTLAEAKELMEKGEKEKVYDRVGKAWGDLNYEKDEYYFMFESSLSPFYEEYELHDLEKESEDDMNEHQLNEHRVQVQLKELYKELWQTFIDGFEENGMRELLRELDELQDLFGSNE